MDKTAHTVSSHSLSTAFPPFIASLLAAAFLLGPASGRAQCQEISAIRLVSFPAEAVNFTDWMNSAGWQSKRDNPRGWEVGGGALHLVSDNNSALIGTERISKRDISGTPVLRLRLKVTTVPAGTDLAHKSGDDAAFRAYVAFDKGGGFLSPPNTLAYTWTETEEAGTVVRSDYYSNLFYISLGKGPTPGDEWITVERDMAADYRLVFPGAQVPPLKGLMIKCDSNNTGTSAEAWLSTIELIPGNR